MLSRFTTLLAAACIGSFAVSAQSALVVDYDVDTNGTGSLAARTVFPNLDLDGDTLNDDSRVLRAFTDVGGTPWSTGAGYVGPTLFGGAIGESFNNPNRNFGDYGLLNIRYQPNATNESGRVHMALIFDASQTGLTFDTGGSGTSSMTVFGNGGAGVNMTRFENLGDVRWLVRNGTSFYVSNTPDREHHERTRPRRHRARFRDLGPVRPERWVRLQSQPQLQHANVRFDRHERLRPDRL